MDSSNGSEFGSEDEDAEFALYAKLYFEENENLTERPIASEVTSSKTEVLDETTRKTPCETNTLKEVVTQNNGTQSLSAENVREVCGGPLQTTPDTLGSSFALSTEATNSSTPHVDTSSPIKKVRSKNTLDKLTGKRPLTKRARTASTCSIESISGKVPLDGLYCNVLQSLDEDKEVACVNDIRQKAGSGKRNKKSLKKRNIEVLSLESSDDEDSRCKFFKNLNVRNKIELHGLGALSSAGSPSDVADSPKQKKVKKKMVHVGKGDLTSVHSKKSLRSEGVTKCAKVSKTTNLDGVTKCAKVSKATNLDGVTKCAKVSKAKNLDGVTKCAKVSKTKNSKVDTKCAKVRKKTRAKISPLSVETIQKGSLVQRKSVVVVTEGMESIESCPSYPQPDCIRISSSDESDSVDYYIGAISPPRLSMNFDPGEIHEVPRNFGKNCQQKKSPKNITPVVPVDYTKRKPLTQRLPSCNRWTQEMAAFYDSDAWEDFEVEEVHDQQSTKERDWKIISSDYYVLQRNRYYNKESRCKLCRQFGHEERDCSKERRCHLCSKTGHWNRIKCPDNCCHRCGDDYHRFCTVTSAMCVCPLCGAKGHIESMCPDLWRRYHSTISGSVPVQAKATSHNRSVKKKYCCSCGRKGHYGFECPEGSRGCYIIQSQLVTSYSEPVLKASGKVLVNMKDAKAAKKVSKYPVDAFNVGLVIGKGGSSLRSISRQTGTTLNYVEHKKDSFIQIIGSLNDQASARAALQETLNLGYSKIHEALYQDKRRNSILNILSDKSYRYQSLEKRLHEIPEAVGLLREGQRNNICSKPYQKRILKFVSQVTFAYLKLEEGQNLMDHLYELETQIRTLGPLDCVPEPILEDLTNTFEKIDSPDFVHLDRILYLVERYLQKQDSKNSIDCKSYSVERNKVTEARNKVTEARNVGETVSNCVDSVEVFEKKKGLDLSMKIMRKDRTKEIISRLLKRKIDSYYNLKSSLPMLPTFVVILKKVQKMNVSIESSPKLLKRVEKTLKLVSSIVLGLLKYGEGKYIMNCLTESLSIISKMSPKKKVPKGILDTIVNNVKMIDEPSVQRLTKILTLADEYLQKEGHQMSLCSNVTKSRGNEIQGCELRERDTVSLNKCNIRNGVHDSNDIKPTPFSRPGKLSKISNKLKKLDHTALNDQGNFEVHKLKVNNVLPKRVTRQHVSSSVKHPNDTSNIEMIEISDDCSGDAIVPFESLEKMGSSSKADNRLTSGYSKGDKRKRKTENNKTKRVHGTKEDQMNRKSIRRMKKLTKGQISAEIPPLSCTYQQKKSIRRKSVKGLLSKLSPSSRKKEKRRHWQRDT